VCDANGMEAFCLDTISLLVVLRFGYDRAKLTRQWTE
jgi:hypothetical protein